MKSEHSIMAIVLCGTHILTTTENIFGTQRLSLPKGHLEPNESLLQCAIRECYEETDVQLTPLNYVCNLDPFLVQFTNHNNEIIHKTITPLVFRLDTLIEPSIKETRISCIEWLELSEFVDKCSYANVGTLATTALNIINNTTKETHQ